MCDKCENIDMEQQNTEEIEEELTYSESEELMGQIQVQEELKRIDIQDKPISKASKEIKNGKLYNDILEQAHAIGESFQVLLKYGIDYSNAVAISSNLMTGKTNSEIEKVRANQVQNQQL